MLSLIRAFVTKNADSKKSKYSGIDRCFQFEDEGAAAAREGKTREDCPYPKSKSFEWNYWVYGNENEQGRMIREFMDAEGEPEIYFTTTRSAFQDAKWDEYSKKCADAEKRMRAAKGWS